MAWVVTSVEAVRYFMKPGNCKTARRHYKKLTEIVAKTGALIVSDEMMYEYAGKVLASNSKGAEVGPDE